jgi:DNA primase
MFIEQFTSWANSQLEYSDAAKEYLLGRGISKEQWAKHKLGFVGGDFDIDPSTDKDHGSTCDDYDKKYLWCDSCRYRSWSSVWEAPEDGGKKICHVGRRIIGGIVFPLTSYSQNIVGFQIRSLERKEYDTFVLKRRPEGYFFGIGPNIESIWSTREAVLVEGPTDQLIFERLVRPDVIALTTSGAGILQVNFLKRFVRRIYLCLDMDDAGRKGVRSFIHQHGTSFDIVDMKYRNHHNAKDCNDLWRKIGDDSFRNQMIKCMNA